MVQAENENCDKEIPPKLDYSVLKSLSPRLRRNMIDLHEERLRQYAAMQMEQGPHVYQMKSEPFIVIEPDQRAAPALAVEEVYNHDYHDVINKISKKRKLDQTYADVAISETEPPKMVERSKNGRFRKPWWKVYMVKAFHSHHTSKEIKQFLKGHPSRQSNSKLAASYTIADIDKSAIWTRKAEKTKDRVPRNRQTQKGDFDNELSFDAILSEGGLRKEAIASTPSIIITNEMNQDVEIAVDQNYTEDVNLEHYLESLTIERVIGYRLQRAKLVNVGSSDNTHDGYSRSKTGQTVGNMDNGKTLLQRTMGFCN